MTAEADDDELQRLLESVLAGERSTSDPQVQAAMRENDRFAREVAGLQQLQARLSERALEVKQDLAHPAPELEAEVEAMVLALGPRRPAAARRWWPWLLAAAVLVVVLAVWPRSEKPKESQHLESPIEVVPTANGHGLQFHFRLTTKGYFVVTVLKGNGERAFPPIEVEDAIWTPTASMVDAWPGGGSVAVEAFTAEKDRIGVAKPIQWSPR